MKAFLKHLGERMRVQANKLRPSEGMRLSKLAMPVLVLLAGFSYFLHAQFATKKLGNQAG